jgi:hypothetical protein
MKITSIKKVELKTHGAPLLRRQRSTTGTQRHEQLTSTIVKKVEGKLPQPPIPLMDQMTSSKGSWMHISRKLKSNKCKSSKKINHSIILKNQSKIKLLNVVKHSDQSFVNLNHLNHPF